MRTSEIIKLGNALREFREQTGMSREEFAIKCGIHPVQYRRYENNAAFPRKETLQKIAENLGVSSEALLEYASRKKESEEITGEKIIDFSDPSTVEQEMQRFQSISAERLQLLERMSRTLVESLGNLIDSGSHIPDSILDSIRDSSERMVNASFYTLRETKLSLLIKCADELDLDGLQLLLNIAESLSCNPKYNIQKKEENNTSTQETTDNTDTQKETPGE